MCFYCGSKFTKKNGFSGIKQRYKCYDCCKQFVGGVRLNVNSIWQDYVFGKQTYKQLSVKYSCSIKTIQRYIDKYNLCNFDYQYTQVVLIVDTTYFGRTLGVMLFKDAYTGKNLYLKFVRYETNELYRLGFEYIQQQGYTINAVVCDGRKGLFKQFGNIPVQMCQFHQVAIVTRYLTRRPKIEASKELREIILMLKDTDKDSFIGTLQDWFNKWEIFFNERSIDNKTGKSSYKHKKLRSAYRSIMSNLPYLFVWYDNLKFKIPNTTNAIDGQFADLKNKLRNHNGLTLDRKKKFIVEFLQVNEVK